MSALGIDHYEHFGSSPAFFARDDYIAHIPIRDPMSVARSWAMRDKPLDEMLMRYQAMLDFIQERSNLIMYKTENIGVVRGSGEYVQGDWDVPKYQAAMRQLIGQADAPLV